MGHALLDRDETQAGLDRRVLVHPQQISRPPRSRQRQDHAEDERDEAADGHALRHEAADLRLIQSHRLELADPKSFGMARLVFGMNHSLDGYVDHMAFAPGPTLFRHFIEQAQEQAGSVYGRRMYEVMRYWDDDHPEWNAEAQAFAAASRKQPK